VNVAVIAVENSAEDVPTLLLVEEDRMFLGSPHCAEKLVKQGSDRRGHSSVKLGVLAEDAGKKRGP
jgi:hypothetical protein